MPVRPAERKAFVNRSGFARAAEANQQTDTGQHQHNAAWFGNNAAVDLVGIKAADRVLRIAQGVSSVTIQPESGDGIPVKASRNAAERQRRASGEAQCVPSTRGGCPVEGNLLCADGGGASEIAGTS